MIKNKTLIVIAHRLSTILDADQILVVDNGKIIQKSVHEDLIEKKAITDRPPYQLIDKSKSGIGVGHQLFIGASGYDNPLRPVGKQKNHDLLGDFRIAEPQHLSSGR